MCVRERRVGVGFDPEEYLFLICISWILQAASAAVGLFLGFTLAVVLTGVAGIAFLWIYGSFWTTGLIIFLGGDVYQFQSSICPFTFLV